MYCTGCVAILSQRWLFLIFSMPVFTNIHNRTAFFSSPPPSNSPPTHTKLTIYFTYRTSCVAVKILSSTPFALSLFIIIRLSSRTFTIAQPPQKNHVFFSVFFFLLLHLLLPIHTQKTHEFIFHTQQLDLWIHGSGSPDLIPIHSTRTLSFARGSNSAARKLVHKLVGIHGDFSVAEGNGASHESVCLPERRFFTRSHFNSKTAANSPGIQGSLFR